MKNARPRHISGRRIAPGRGAAVITLAGQDIAPLPEDRGRRPPGADRDFKFFCETYFPHLFTLAGSQDHLRVIAKIERVVRYHETLAVAMPRGSGKTTLCLVSVLWAVLSGQHQFVFLIASAGGVGPVDAGESQEPPGGQRSAAGGLSGGGPSDQVAGGRGPGAAPASDTTAFPRGSAGVWTRSSCRRSLAAGAQVRSSASRASPATSAVRLHVRSDGSQVRPTLVVCDDPQTDQSAHSLLQTAERLSIINGAHQGPGRPRPAHSDHHSVHGDPGRRPPGPVPGPPEEPVLGTASGPS